MDGLGCYERACTCSPGLVGFSVTAKHRLVMDVFWTKPYRLVIGHCQLVDSGGGDCYPDIQANQDGSCQPDDAIGGVAGVCLGPELFSMAIEWWGTGVCFLSLSIIESNEHSMSVLASGKAGVPAFARLMRLKSASYQLADAPGQNGQVVSEGVTDQSHQDGSWYKGFAVVCGHDRSGCCTTDIGC